MFTLSYLSTSSIFFVGEVARAWATNFLLPYWMELALGLCWNAGKLWNKSDGKVSSKINSKLKLWKQSDGKVSSKTNSKLKLWNQSDGKVSSKINSKLKLLNQSAGKVSSNINSHLELGNQSAGKVSSKVNYSLVICFSQFFNRKITKERSM